MKRVFAGIIICTLGQLCGWASATEDKPSKRSFSLVVREGFGSIAVGDLNTTLYSLDHNAVYEMLRQYYPERCVGEILGVPTRFTNWEAELQWNFWRGFSVGVAVSGPMHFHQKSFLTYTIIDYAGTQTMNDTWEPEISVSAPVKLSLYYSFPIFSKLNVIVNGGAGYYHARMAVSKLRQSRFPLDDSSLTSFDIDATGRHVGYHCGFALEYKFNERFSMIAESQWRFAKIKSLQGSEAVTGKAFDAEGNLILVTDNMTKYGFLYHLTGEDLYTGARIEQLAVEDFPPPWYGPDFPADIRHAFLDLSGFAFSIGFRIRLF